MMRTLLTIKKDNKLVYRDYSRSFTKQFIQALYLAHTATLTAGAIACPDVAGFTSKIADQDVYSIGTSLSPKSNMLVASPSGEQTMQLFDGSVSSLTFDLIPSMWLNIPANLIGIQVGRGATAVAPTNAYLVDRIQHGTGATAVAALIENNVAAENTDLSGSATISSVGLYYIPLKSFSITSIRIKVWKTGNPGNVTASIRGFFKTSGGVPTIDATTLATSNVVNANLWLGTPGQFEEFTFAAPVVLHAGLCYIFLITPAYASAGNLVNMRVGTVATFNSYRMGEARIISGVLGFNNNNASFQPYGTTKAEFKYGATEISDFVVADPNASFIIKRLFNNKSGESVEVNECGLYLPLGHRVADIGNHINQPVIVCAARDVIAPHIDVADGETLEVTYTPSITV
jgi:hypothetical protein